MLPNATVSEGNVTMSTTIKGGSSPRQVAAARGRKLIREQGERKREFELLREEGNKPSLKLGPLLNNTKRT